MLGDKARNGSENNKRINEHRRQECLRVTLLFNIRLLENALRYDAYLPIDTSSYSRVQNNMAQMKQQELENANSDHNSNNLNLPGTNEHKRDLNIVMDSLETPQQITVVSSVLNRNNSSHSVRSISHQSSLLSQDVESLQADGIELTPVSPLAPLAPQALGMYSDDLDVDISMRRQASASSSGSTASTDSFMSNSISMGITLDEHGNLQQKRKNGLHYRK